MLKLHITRGALRVSGMTRHGEPYARTVHTPDPFKRANALAESEILNDRQCTITVDNAVLKHAHCGRKLLSSSLPSKRDECPACGRAMSLNDLEFAVCA